jgi:hypothetical protein
MSQRKKKDRLYIGPQHYHRPNYMPAVEALGEQVWPGEVRQILIAHDDWCDIFKGRGCNCDPDVRFVPIITEARP